MSEESRKVFQIKENQSRHSSRGTIINKETSQDLCTGRRQDTKGKAGILWRGMKDIEQNKKMVFEY